MNKLLGAVLLIGGTAALGLSSAAALARKAETIRCLIDALERMEHELSFRLTPVPELLLELSESVEGEAGSFFTFCLNALPELGERSLSQIWEDGSRTCFTSIGQEELRILQSLGQTLGRYDAEGQRGALLRAREELSCRLRVAREERKRLGKVYSALGVAAGVFLTILLL